MRSQSNLFFFRIKKEASKLFETVAGSATRTTKRGEENLIKNNQRTSTRQAESRRIVCRREGSGEGVDATRVSCEDKERRQEEGAVCVLLLSLLSAG